jgi:hypothetical protein
MDKIWKLVVFDKNRCCNDLDQHCIVSTDWIYSHFSKTIIFWHVFWPLFRHFWHFSTFLQNLIKLDKIIKFDMTTFSRSQKSWSRFSKTWWQDSRLSKTWWQDSTSPHSMSPDLLMTTSDVTELFHDQKIFSTSDEKIFMSTTTITTWSAIIVGWKICVSRSRYRAIRSAILEYVCMSRMANWKNMVTMGFYQTSFF